MISDKKYFLSIFFLLTVFFNLSPAFSSINSLQQYGLNAGDLPDPESDTILVNPAYGYTVEKARLSMNFFYGADSIDEPDETGYYTVIGLQNSGFLDLNYLQPISGMAGFYLNVTPVIQDYVILYNPDYGYGALDIGGGFWFQVLPGFTAGLSGKYFSGKLGNKPGLYTENERTLDSFFLRVGISIDLSAHWNIGYALQYQPGNGAASIASTMERLNNDSYLYPFWYDYNPDFSHDFFIRGGLSDTISLANHFDLRLDSIIQQLYVSPIFTFKVNTTTLLAGITYGYFNSMAGLSRNIYQTKDHSFEIISGAGFTIVPWLQLRLAVSLFSLIISKSQNPFNVLSLFPQFQGGLGLRISPSMDFEFNLSKIMFYPLGSWQTILCNFELSYNFS